MSTIRLLSRLAGLLSAALLVTTGGGLAATAYADGDDGPAIASSSSQSSSFELFGRKICVADARPGECDVRLDKQLLTPLVVDAGKAKRWRVRGVTFCAHEDRTGAKCDFVWKAPAPAMAWRDFPEVQLAEALNDR